MEEGRDATVSSEARELGVPVAEGQAERGGEGDGAGERGIETGRSMESLRKRGSGATRGSGERQDALVVGLEHALTDSV